MAREAALAGNVAIPMVKALTALVAKSDPEAAAFVHWGATSQDAMDTGLVLQLRTRSAIDLGLTALSWLLVHLAQAHKSTLVAGRTWLQQGPPVSLGLKAAGWLGAIDRDQARLRETRKRLLVLQFGGAVGTLAALGNRGLEVAAALAEELKLEMPELPWHAQRDRVAEVATTLGLLLGSLGKMARDISLMAQSEVDELQEPSAGGPRRFLDHAAQAQSGGVRGGAGCGNPRSGAGLSDAQRDGTRTRAWPGRLARGVGDAAGDLPAHRREPWLRRPGSWKVWKFTPRRWPRISISHRSDPCGIRGIRAGSEDRKSRRAPLVEQTCRRAVESRRLLRDVLGEDKEVRAHLSVEEIARLLEPKNYLGSAERMIENALLARGKGKP